jgi:micrococcal nuclease
MGAPTRRLHSLLLALLATVLMSAGGLMAWAARPTRPARRPARRPHATRPHPRPARRPHPRVHPKRPRPVVRVVPRGTAVVLHETEPETEEVVRDAGSLPPTALQASDDADATQDDAAAPKAYPVTAVGDDLTLTVTVDGRATPVRLLGVAEATVTGGRPPITPRAFLRNLLAGEFVQLVADEALEDTDAEGRRVAYVYRAPDGLLVNLELVRQGYAVTTQDYAFEHLDAFLIYQRRARADDRGLWATVDDGPAEHGQVASETPAE